MGSSTNNYIGTAPATARVWTCDEEVWEAFKQGDEQAYEAMFKRNYGLLLNYGLRFCQDKEEVRDCVQQLFLGLWESRERLGKNTSIRSYLLASVRRLILRRSKRKVLTMDIDDLNPAFLAQASAESDFIRSQREKAQVKFVADLINKLPNRQKEALYLKYYGEHNFSEIAVIMGISTRVVYKLIYKALDRLSGEIGEKRSKILSFFALSTT